MNKVSVIIPTFNRPNLLKWGLYSLSQQSIPFKYEIIVINDGKEDETKDICDSFKDKLNIQYIFSGQRNKDDLKLRVPGFAFNIGAKKANGEFLILMSPEIFLLDNHTILKISNILETNATAMVITNGKDDREGWERPAGFLEHLEKNDGNYKNFRNFKIMNSLNTKLPFFIGISRQNFLDIGGFDEDFTGYCFDDNDLVTRLEAFGCYYVQIDSTIIHL